MTDLVLYVLYFHGSFNFQDKPRRVPRPSHSLLATVLLHAALFHQEGALQAGPRGRPNARLRFGVDCASRLRGRRAPGRAAGALPVPHIDGILHILRTWASLLLDQDLLPLPYIIRLMCSVSL